MGLYSWDSNSDYSAVGKRGADPRFVAVVVADRYPEPPESGEGFNDVKIAIIGGSYGRDDYISPDDNFRQIVSRAWFQLGDYNLVERYLRVFHNAVAVRAISYGERGEATLWAMIEEGHDAPDPEKFLKAVVQEWADYNNGDVYAVGVLFNPEHVLWGEDEDTPLDEEDGWSWNDGLIYGFYGDKWAEESALDMLKWAEESADMQLLEFAV